MKCYPIHQAGEPVIVRWRTEDFLFCCCDCKLVHRLRFKVNKGVLVFQAWRDDRRTVALRRHRGRRAPQA